MKADVECVRTARSRPISPAQCLVESSTSCNGNIWVGCSYSICCWVALGLIALLPNWGWSSNGTVETHISAPHDVSNFLCSMLQLLVTSNVPSFQVLVTPMTEALCSSENVGFYKTQKV
jgi:hypothetical protein